MSLSAEQLFNSASLSLLVPYSSVEFPSESEDLVGDDWLEALGNVVERRKAFYGQCVANMVDQLIHCTDYFLKTNDWNPFCSFA